MNIHTDTIHKILAKAGEKILEIYEEKHPEVLTKKDESPVTKADLASNKIIVEALTLTYPDIPMISEENSIPSYQVRRNYEYFWLLDPLDGTKEFINKTGEFVINLALVHKKEVVAGFVYLPCFKELYYAQKGQGAFRISGGNVFKLKVSEYPASNETLRIPVSRFHPHEKTENFISKMGNVQRLEIGSALKILYITLGKADVYPRLSNLYEWDIAAPQIILEEAGGSVLTLYQKKKMGYGRRSLRLPHFMASSRAYSDDLL